MDTAVALKYGNELPAPIIVGKGKKELAKQLIAIAQEYGVPVLEEKELAEVLIHFDTGEYIPEEVYEVVAKILVFIQQVEK